MIPIIIFIHGASSTPISFNYIRDNLPEHEAIMLTYDCERSLNKILPELHEQLPGDKPLFLVGHSLGGVIASSLAYIEKNEKNLQKIITMSSPFAGSKMATYLKWMYPHYGLFDNVSTSNPIIMNLQRYGAKVPTLAIVTSGGNTPLIKGKNDGVVSVSSQLSLKKSKFKSFELNHFEVLLSKSVVEEIKRFFWEKEEKSQ